jgi:hypothetical protein
VANQPIHLATRLSKTDEDDSGSTSSEEEVVRVSPAMMRKFSSSSPPKPILSSTPVNGNLTNTRPTQTERVLFAPPKVGLFLSRTLKVLLRSRLQETPKENENNLSQSRTRPIEKQTSQGPKVAPQSRKDRAKMELTAEPSIQVNLKQPSPTGVLFPEQPRQTPGPKKPVAATEAKKDPAPEPVGRSLLQRLNPLPLSHPN